MLARIKAWARSLKAETLALSLAVRDPRTPWYAKLLIAAVAAYALSPIDLIPDFVPVLGYLDDLLIVPAGIALAVRLVPPDVLSDCRDAARARLADGRPRSYLAAAVIVCVWATALALLGSAAWSRART